MADDKIKELNDALDKVSNFLDQDAVKTALKAIPPTLKDPVVKGLGTVLDAIKSALDELKKQLGNVGTIKDLLKVINDLLDAAAALASSEADALKKAKDVVQTLTSLPGEAEINAVIAKIDTLIGKLKSI